MGKGSIINRLIVGLFGLLLLFSVAQAAVAPESNKLLTIPNVSFPNNIVVSENGMLFVADSVKNIVWIYDSKGNLSRFLKLNFKPACLALAPSGSLYIAGKNRIDLYSGSELLASYKDIVSTPSSMVFLNGKLYVADGYFIRVFDSGMNKILEFGGYAGSDNIERQGKFNELDEIAVDYNNSQLYVLDRGAVRTVSGYGNTYVWRVQVFDENGNFIRTFSNYGYGQEGKLGNASSIAVDKESRVYISDNVQNIIVVYDSYGSYLKTIYSLTDPVYSPVSLYFNNDRLYAGSSLAKSLYVFGIDQYALLKVEPLSLQFTSQGAGVNGSLTISNVGTKDLDFTVSSASSWINLSQSSGTVAPGSSFELGLTINPLELSEGTYNGSIAIISNGGSETVSVTLNIVEPPTLSVSPASFNIVKKKGSPSDPLIVDITLSNDLSGSLSWSASSDSPWLTITPTSGSSNSTVSANIIVNTNLDPGKYTGNIIVTAPGASSSPAIITVNLEIRANRKIAVMSNIESASFTVAGPVKFEGTGSSYIIDNAPSGTYTVTFKPVKGYKTPEPQTGTLLAEGELVFNGTYQSLGQKLNIITSHGPGNKDNMEIRIYNGNAQLIKTIAPVKPYNRGATTATGDINGDGINELIIGTGPGAKVPPVVTVIDMSGNILGEFRPFSGTGYGVELSLADLDRDGAAEIITAKTKKFAGTPLVDLKVFKYINGQFVDKGIKLKHRGANGIRIASADLDGDGVPEVLVMSARGRAPVYVYKIDTTQDIWSAVLLDEFEGCNGSGGSNIAAGDTDGDGGPEIILSCHYDTGTKIRIISHDGSLIREFLTGSTLKDYVAAGDLDDDGIAEIIVGDGPAAQKTKVKIFNPDGGLLRSFDAFDMSFGVRISTGKFE